MKMIYSHFERRSTVKHCRRDAVEAWGDEAAAFNDGESPYCLALRLCRGRFEFDSGRALLAGGLMASTITPY